jgi:hypothetical protein
MRPCTSNENELAPSTRDFYYQVLTALDRARLPFLVGGAYAFGCYTDITRGTKDLDLFVCPSQTRDILGALAAAGYKTELTNPVWLAKAFQDEGLVDVIFSSGNGIATVDDEWFKYAVEGELLGLSVRLIPVEEMIWSKGYVMTRERYDGADIAHLLRAHAEKVDWKRLLRRFGPDWRVLVNHLLLFGYIYPSERARIPAWVMEELLERLGSEIHTPPPEERACRGVLLSDTQYEADIAKWGYKDPRSFAKG